MTQTHTPGPWESGHFDDIDDEIIIQTHEGEYVASIDCDGAYEGKIAKCIDANARLIAAAPDMLEGHEENARILGYLVNELQGLIPAGKLAAIEACQMRSVNSSSKAKGLTK